MEFLRALRCCYEAPKNEKEFQFTDDIKLREKKLKKSSSRSATGNEDLSTNFSKYYYNKNKDSNDFNETADKDEILIDEKYIREDEKKALKFSINGIVDFIDKLNNDSDWSLLYNQSNLVMHNCKNGSPITKDFFLGKHTYRMEKSKFKDCKGITVETIANMITIPEHRLCWDKSPKEMLVLFGNNASCIMRKCFTSPFFFISERDAIDKQIKFKHEKSIYSLSTHVNDFYPEDNKYVRVNNYINFFMISDEEDSIEFLGFSQLDLKMMIPQSFLAASLPFKVLEWYKSLEQHLLTTMKEEKKDSLKSQPTIKSQK